MRNDDYGDDISTNDLSSNRFEYLYIVLIVKHGSSEEGQSDFMENVYQIAKFVLVWSYYQQINKHQGRDHYKSNALRLCWSSYS